MEVFNNERLYAYTQKGMINNTMVFQAIFESLEEQLIETQKKIVDKLKHHKVGSLLSFYSTFKNFQQTLETNLSIFGVPNLQV